MQTPVQVIRPREVPLGGLRAMTVRRTLPARERSFVGAWCFADHYGPDPVEETGGMDLAPHPHCGLATVSWLFSGELEHRDSLGTREVVRPGEVNLMTAGRGIAHSEVSTAGTSVLHGAQLWLALPAASAGMPPRFEHHAPPVLEPAHGVRAQVFVGELWGSASPVRVETPLVGAEVSLVAGASVEVPVPGGFELAVLVDSGSVTVAAQALAAAEMGVLEAGAVGDGGVVMTAGDEGARVLLLGGEPFGEEVVMWWNFVGRSHEDVASAREAWEAEAVAYEEGSGAGQGPTGAGSGRFGTVPGYEGEVSRIPAPALPGVHLRPRGNRGTHPHPAVEAPALS
jgi:redox-sensitive bicupin YhaK (pirin superfamily)